MRDWTFKQLGAEFMAMVLFVWIGTGSAVSSNFFTPGDGVDPARLLTIAIAFGFGITVLAYGIGDISGGHINPAVTFAMILTRQQSIVAGILYMIAQFAGAVCGSLLVWASAMGLTSGCADTDYVDGVCSASMISEGTYGPAFAIGVNQVSSRITIGSAFVLEAVGTFLLVITVLLSAVSKKSTAGNAAPLAIGFSVMLAHINLIPFTGCGINPARSLGPMVVDSIGGLSGIVWIRGWWIYYSAPFAGAAVAAMTYGFIFAECDKSEEEEELKPTDTKEEEIIDVETAP